MRVVVVGAGLGGLAAAAHLTGDHHDVTILERGPRPGGRAGIVEREGFRLDNGPTVMTMPGLLADVFAAAGADMADHVQLRPVDPMYRAVYADGSVLHVRHGREAMTEEIGGFAGPDAAASFGRFADWLTELYRVEMPNFIDADFDSALDLVARWRAGSRLVRLGGFGRLGRKVASFFDDERLQRIFGFQAMYAGVAPHEALALYSVITYMDAIEGVFVPVGGMHRIATGLADAARKAGVDIRYDAPVTRILRGAEGEVTGVEVGGDERLAADVVVCNADLPVAYRTLLGGVDAPRVARRGRYSPSCLLWVAGVRGAPPVGAAHHNIHFGRQWAESFDAIIRDGHVMADPSVLVTLHSLDDPSLAPPGCSTLYALEPVPNLDGKVDWSYQRDVAMARLRGLVAAADYPVDIVTEAIYDPLDWEAQGMERGTPFALAHTFRQTGPFRPRNIDRRVPGLVFVGSSTVPGVGVPMVLVSGKLAAARVRDIATAAGRDVTVTLEASYDECRRLNKRYGTTYYWSTAVLPSVKRHHVHTLYAFCRCADDIDEDLDRGRQYVPQEDVQRFGADLTTRQCTPAFVDLMRFEIDRCRELYRYAETGIAMLPGRSARCVAAAHDLYGRILDRIEAQGYDVFAKRARVSTPVKLVVAARHVRA